MLLNCQSKLNVFEEKLPEVPSEPGLGQPASSAPLTMPDEPRDTSDLAPTTSLALRPSSLSAPPTTLPTTSVTAQPLGSLTQAPSGLFTTSSGERIRFAQEDGEWQAIVPAFPQAYTAQRTLRVVSPASIGPQLACLHQAKPWTSRSRIHLLNTSHAPYTPCVYLGQLGLLGGTPSTGETPSAGPPAAHAHADPRLHPGNWCISYDQLLAVDQKARSHYGAHTYPQVTVRDICTSIIIPECKRTGQSYALSKNPQGLAIDTFVTHSWDGHFAEFVQAIRHAFHTTFKRPNLWICAFALKQSDDESVIKRQIDGGDQEDEDLRQSPFMRALQSAKSFCVVRNANADLYARIWCVYELMYANQYGLFPDRIYVTGPDTFKDTKTSCLDAQSSKATDRIRIMRELLTVS